MRRRMRWRSGIWFEGNFKVLILEGRKEGFRDLFAAYPKKEIGTTNGHEFSKRYE